jgi:ABC-type transport system involved in multi-copper enzyme maturation permease subunit
VKQGEIQVGNQRNDISLWQKLSAFSRGILALFFRSLRTESRLLRMHLLWLLQLVVIYFAMWTVSEQSRLWGAPGLAFFQGVMYLNVAFISLLGVSFFSTVISEEKEEDTLGLMTMAGISPLGILLGKSTSRLFQVALLLALQYPFTLLAVTLGGLMPTQIFSAYMALLSYTILLANVGLLCSVACRTSRNASGLTTFWLLGYMIIPAFSYGGFMYLSNELRWGSGFVQQAVLAVLEWAAHSNVVSEITASTSTGHQFRWSAQNVGNAVGGLICFLMAWGLFGIVAKEPSLETASRGMVARRTSRYFWWFSAGRVWNSPLVWKDFFFTAGGWAGLMIRTMLYSGLFGLCYAANRPWYYGVGMPTRWSDVNQGFQVFAHVLLAVDIALCASRVFHDEIKGQTLSSLLMLPDSTANLVYSKVTGCGLATSPGILAMLVSLFLLPGGLENLSHVGDQPWFWWWICNLLLAIHLTALFSLYLRTGAFVLAVGTTFGLMVLTGFVVAMLSFGAGGANTADGLIGLVDFVLILACVGIHYLILNRMPILGEK